MFYINRPVFTLNHLNIPTVNQSKYIGIIISENNCAPDLKRQIRKFSRCSPNMKFLDLNPTVLTSIVPYYGMIVLKLH